MVWLGRRRRRRAAGLRETRDELRNVTIRPIRMTIDVDEAPASVADGYLRLHLLSGRFAAPRSINLDGIFGTLTNVAWTSAGPVALHELDATRIRVRAAGQHLTVNGVDKFPRMTDYVVPSGVRIADASRVQLGLTSPKAPRSCMKDSVTSMPAPLERQWSRPNFRRRHRWRRKRCWRWRIDYGHAVGRWHRSNHRW